MRPDEARRALEHPNVRAFLRGVLRTGESHPDDPNAYRALFGWHATKNPDRVFYSFEDHPRDRTYEAYDGQFLANGRIDFTTAAGAYQITATTHDGACRKYGPRKFAPEDQDRTALDLIAEKGALEDVRAGRLVAAIAKCVPLWASLPGARTPQPQRALAQLRAAFVKYGGVELAVAPPKMALGGEAVRAPEPTRTEPKEPTMEPVTLSLVAGLASKVIDLFSPLAKEKISKEIRRHSDNPQVAEQVASSVIEAAKEITGKADALEAVVAARDNPVAVAQIEDRALENLAKLSPILDKVAEYEERSWKAEEASREAAAARGRAEPADLAPMLARWAVHGVYGLLILLFALIVAGMIVSPDHKPVGELVTAFTGLVMLIAGKFGTVYDYRFGSSRGSGAKDIVIAELSNRPK